MLLSEGLRAKLAKLWAWKASEGESLDRAAPFFVSQRGTRLSTRQLRHAFAVWHERAGLDRQVSLHMLRHSAISSLYVGTNAIRLAQRFARHRIVVTTMVYTSATPAYAANTAPRPAFNSAHRDTPTASAHSRALGSTARRTSPRQPGPGATIPQCFRG